MNQLLDQIKKYLSDRSDADWIGDPGQHVANDEMTLGLIIEANEKSGDDPDYMWAEIQSYCEDKGLTEWAQQIENYFINTSIG